MDSKSLQDMLNKHTEWIRTRFTHNVRGERADLQGVDLWGANLWDADLRDADLRRANLRNADLRYADLRGADLLGADLRDADLWGANLDIACLPEKPLFGNRRNKTHWLCFMK